MNWTENKPPIEGESYYDHTTCKTPLGLLKIEWKSWKDSPSYGIELEGNWIGSEYTLEEAKMIAKNYINKVSNELITFLKDEN